MLYLSGQLPLSKVPVLHRRVDELNESAAFDSNSSNREQVLREVRNELCELVDWEKLSDGNAFDESYGEESHYGSEAASHLDEDVAMMLDGVDNEMESSDEQKQLKELEKEKEDRAKKQAKREKKHKHKKSRSGSKRTNSSK